MVVVAVLPIRGPFDHRIGPRRERPLVGPSQVDLAVARQIDVGQRLIGRHPHPRNAAGRRIKAVPKIGVDRAREVAGRNLVRRIGIHRQQVDPLVVNRVRRKHLATAQTGVAIDAEVQRGGGAAGAGQGAVDDLHGDGIPALPVDLRGAHHARGWIQAHSFRKTGAGGRHHRPRIGRRPAGCRQRRAVALILRGHGHAAGSDRERPPAGGLVVGSGRRRRASRHAYAARRQGRRIVRNVHRHGDGRVAGAGRKDIASRTGERG